jgi:hypothetical protein
MWINSSLFAASQNFMDQNNQDQAPVIPQDSAEFGNVPKAAESFRTIPKGSETFGSVRNDAEGFRSIPKHSERKDNHSLTVREAARLFEAAGVARTERSIVNWCQPNRQGICRLDCYFDPNERKYYITPQSVETAIAEEEARAAKTNQSSESVGTVPKGSELPPKTAKSNVESNDERTKELERENLDLKIANRGKDFLIEQMQKERTGFFDQLLTATRKVGELETRLLQLATSHDSAAEKKN